MHFPGINPHLLTLTSNFHVPIYRDILLHLGICSVSKRSCANILKRGAGEAICIVIGGAAESLSAHPGTADLTLKRRLGFVKIAMQHGADLVPVFSFGENDIYEQLSNEKGTTVYKLQTKFQSVFGFTLPLFHGRGLLNYNFGLMPYRRPIVSVVGRPIHVTKIVDPSKAQVEATQKLYIEELMRSNINNPINERQMNAITTEAKQPQERDSPPQTTATETLDLGKESNELNSSNENSDSPANTTMVDKVTEKIRGQSMVDATPPTAEVGQARTNIQRSHSGSEGESSDKETSRKRKLSSQSSVATETAVRQHLKRPKESDVPEREEDSEDVATNISVPKSPKSRQAFGFGAFASSKSPFASAQSVCVDSHSYNNHSAYSLSKSTSATPALIPESQTRVALQTSEFVAKNETNESVVPGSPNVNPPSSAPERRTNSGFAAFASVSPFQNVGSMVQPAGGVNPTSPARESLAGPVRRSKSPVGKHQAFGQYSTGVSRFGAHSTRKITQDDGGQPTGDVTEKSVLVHPEFADILQAKGEPNEEPDENVTKLEIQQIQYNTGEEEDFTVFQTRAKLYTQDEQFAYKERGTGLLKINVRRSDGEGARIVMRAEGVLRLLLNMALYPGLICELGPDPKFVKVAEITPNERKFHAIKVGSTKLAQELFDQLTENTPTTSTAAGA
ncbi:Diacylglycerol O-acyltransferase 2B [Rhizoctonia solani AG-1 IB]|uniref:diacylglycerol O-acyltransferase n=1 Tax=Thanatephorus cucumeris (strain AG1-IB / isolate 7/3/14) TaxID=1108050 RepID=M5BRR5_THACB|nr:Diacylglycerol O-acyltransferase 2B [Rhizoctonia solani AG-1 IB]